MKDNSILEIRVRETGCVLKLLEISVLRQYELHKSLLPNAQILP